MVRSTDRAGRGGRRDDPATRRRRRVRGDAPAGRDRRAHRGGRHRRSRGAGDRVRRALGLAVGASRRVVRVAGHTVAASVATPDPGARPVRAAAVRPVRRYPGWQRGPGAPVLVVATVMALIVAMLGVERFTGVNVLPEQLSAGLRPPPRKFPVLPASPPTNLTIGKIGLRAPVHPVGIARDGSIDVPATARAQEAGWYDQGPTPGQYGPAVIVGHVDTTTGPAVFHDLKSLADGDRVEVTRQDRSVAEFEVTEIRRYGKERLPVDEIYGDFSRPNLRLITCGGRWVGGETGYADNLVVYASLVGAR
ncbi:class F sortase [Micromonospora sp. PLK6-60]|uniref:class F sortase n=1 Tax=Micromonospora sp. PLK6-60 TaxID=2873383 RepID=UPI001CA65A6E|nr:class F sortase [Micromonospora sp. PLK6-60]MBY8873239.1 class F sortase [Micromonospora sp. PLK6-60]